MARYLVVWDPGATRPTRVKYIDDAVGPPDVNVDAGTDGVSFGSILWDGTDLWFCVDPTTAAAVWVQLNGGGSGDLSTLAPPDLSVSGATDVDRNDGATHDLTLTGNSTLTPIHSDPTPGDAIDLRVRIRQDGVGSRTLAWGGTIDWAGGSAPTMPTAADAYIDVGLLSLDDAATWTGYVTEDPVLDLEGLSDVDLTSPTEGDTLRYRSGEWVNEAGSLDPDDVRDAGRWEPVQYDDGSSPWPFVYFGDEIVVAWVPT